MGKGKMNNIYILKEKYAILLYRRNNACAFAIFIL
jgi:hypothetical protein